MPACARLGAAGPARSGEERTAGPRASRRRRADGLPPCPRDSASVLAAMPNDTAHGTRAIRTTPRISRPHGSLTSRQRHRTSGQRHRCFPRLRAFPAPRSPSLSLCSAFEPTLALPRSACEPQTSRACECIPPLALPARRPLLSPDLPASPQMSRLRAVHARRRRAVTTTRRPELAARRGAAESFVSGAERDGLSTRPGVCMVRAARRPAARRRSGGSWTRSRRGAGAVERGGLENRWARKRPQGSNPCLSATQLLRSVSSQLRCGENSKENQGFGHASCGPRGAGHGPICLRFGRFSPELWTAGTKVRDRNSLI